MKLMTTREPARQHVRSYGEALAVEQAYPMMEATLRYQQQREWQQLIAWVFERAESPSRTLPPDDPRHDAHFRSDCLRDLRRRHAEQRYALDHEAFHFTLGELISWDIPDAPYQGVVGDETSERLDRTTWERLREFIFARDAYTCLYCGGRGETLHCDHIIPISRGGTNDPDNLATACATCNQRKHAHLLDEWEGWEQ